jgi:hypothetical protein
VKNLETAETSVMEEEETQNKKKKKTKRRRRPHFKDEYWFNVKYYFSLFEIYVTSSENRAYYLTLHDGTAPRFGVE